MRQLGMKNQLNELQKPNQLNQKTLLMLKIMDIATLKQKEPSMTVPSRKSLATGLSDEHLSERKISYRHQSEKFQVMRLLQVYVLVSFEEFSMEVVLRSDQLRWLLQ